MKYDKINLKSVTRRHRGDIYFCQFYNTANKRPSLPQHRLFPTDQILSEFSIPVGCGQFPAFCHIFTDVSLRQAQLNKVFTCSTGQAYCQSKFSMLINLSRGQFERVPLVHFVEISEMNMVSLKEKSVERIWVCNSY